jgi:two-component system, NarL family, sensor kinase
LVLGREALKELRTLCYRLHPPMLDELGLIPAVQAFVEGFSLRSGIRVDSEMPDTFPRLAKDLEVTLFYVVQEGLTNVQRHSHSSRAKVCLKSDSKRAIVNVENEGSGLPPLSAGGLKSTKIGVGIGGMRERVIRLGGQVHIYSRAKHTILEASLPLPRFVFQ